MKKSFFLLLIGSISFFACNNNKNEHEGHDMTDASKDTAMSADKPADAEIKTVQVMFTGIDPKAHASIKEIVDHYLHVKNALANDNGPEAARGATAMAVAMKNLDKSLLSAEQKTAYDKVETALKEQATQIAGNGDKIDVQRAGFSMMSESVYELVKSFGAGRPMYHDHCPMAKDNQGAMWMSENKEIKNPYFGAKMPTCGTVEEVVQ